MSVRINARGEIIMDWYTFQKADPNQIAKVMGNQARDSYKPGILSPYQVKEIVA